MSRPRASALLVATVVVVPALASAQDLGTGRRVHSPAKITQVEVGDVLGHVVGVVEFKGSPSSPTARSRRTTIPPRSI